jgi:ferredoxin
MILIDNTICDHCGTCAACCPQNAISVLETNCSIDPGRCNECQQCLPVCPVKAITSGINEK